MKFFIFLCIYIFLSQLAFSKEVFSDLSLHSKVNTSILYGRQKVGNPYYSEEIRYQQALAAFNSYLQYEMIFRNFFFSIAPQYKIESSEHYFLLKEYKLSYNGNLASVSFEKTIEQRSLSYNKDFLVIPNRDIAYNDDFPFWKLSAVVPIRSWIFELGTKAIRDTYKKEWEQWDSAIWKGFLYSDLDYKFLFLHFGYAYYFDDDTDTQGSNYTGKISFTYRNIIIGYFSNMLIQDFSKKIEWANYTYVSGIDFSLGSLLNKDIEIFDLRLNTELIYSAEKYEIASTLSGVYKMLTLSNNARYVFKDETLYYVLSAEIQIEEVTFSFFDRLNVNYDTEEYSNMIGLELSFDKGGIL